MHETHRRVQTARRAARAGALLALLILLPAPASAAVQCGANDPAANTPAKARLTLDSDSKTTIAFARDTQPQGLELRFKVAGCEIPSDAPRPLARLASKSDTRDIPDGVVSLLDAVSDGTEYTVTLRANPNAFDPGTYGGFIELRAPFLSVARTPIALSRSESREGIPIFIGVLGGLAGILWFVLLNAAKGATTTIRRWHYAAVFVAAAVAGIIAVESAYRAQDVWSLEDNWLSALVAAFTGATTGTMATAIGVLFPRPKD